MQVGTPSQLRNPIPRQSPKARQPGTCRGPSAWHGKRELTETGETRRSPHAPTAGTKGGEAFNDKQNASPPIRESDRFIVARRQRAKGPTPPRSLHRKPAP